MNERQTSAAYENENRTDGKWVPLSCTPLARGIGAVPSATVFAWSLAITDRVSTQSTGGDCSSPSSPPKPAEAQGWVFGFHRCSWKGSEAVYAFVLARDPIAPARALACSCHLIEVRLSRPARAN